MKCYRSPRCVLHGVLSAILVGALAAVTAAGDDTTNKQGAKKEELIQKDHKLIEGAWRILSIENDGVKIGLEDLKKFRVVNGADGSWSVRDGDTEIARGTSTFDPTQTPKAIDFNPIENGEKKATYVGIYELGEKNRKLCFAQPGDKRPTDFAAPLGSKHTYVTFERAK